MPRKHLLSAHNSIMFNTRYLRLIYFICPLIDYCSEVSFCLIYSESVTFLCRIMAHIFRAVGSAIPTQPRPGWWPPCAPWPTAASSSIADSGRYSRARRDFQRQASDPRHGGWARPQHHHVNQKHLHTDPRRYQCNKWRPNIMPERKVRPSFADMN